MLIKLYYCTNCMSFEKERLFPKTDTRIWAAVYTKSMAKSYYLLSKQILWTTADFIGDLKHFRKFALSSLQFEPSNLQMASRWYMTTLTSCSMHCIVEIEICTNAKPVSIKCIQDCRHCFFGFVIYLHHFLQWIESLFT